VTARHQGGRAVGVDLVTAFRAEQRPLGGVPGGRWSGETGTAVGVDGFPPRSLSLECEFRTSSAGARP
jgi:hypothetical protein